MVPFVFSFVPFFFLLFIMTTFPRNNTAEISKMPMPTPTPVVSATPHPSAHPSSSAFPAPLPLPNSHNQSGGRHGPMSRLHRIASPSDLSLWKKSETCQDLQAFVAAVGTACNGITTGQRQADFEARLPQPYPDRDPLTLMSKQWGSTHYGKKN